MVTRNIEESNLPVKTPKGLRVLLVEDNPETAESLAFLISMCGHEVRVAQDGVAALHEAQGAKPDVVLLDIGLPGDMDGYEVAKRLQEWKADKKPLLVAITAFSTDADRRQSEAVGIDLYLVKPADLEYVLGLLERFQRVLEW